MLTHDQIQAFIFRALQSINEERSPDAQIPLSPDTRLFGEDAELDSLSLVSVIVDVEMWISEASRREISLSDDRAMSQEISPFSTVKSLNAYISTLLADT